MEILISVLGAISAILVSVTGAILANRNSNMLQLRKLKEDHYISYIEALHNLATDNHNKELTSKYTYYRDKLLIVGSETVVKCILLYENEAVGKANELHDKYLTDIVKAIRKDLNIKDKDYPNIYLKK
ncbi:MAG: hypothetical protein VB082_04390 [Christensenella sp.]|nr:hypothetical protein [Christensenella sp.]